MGNVADCIAKTDKNTLSQMQESLWALQQSYPDARIILDLSGTDDLTAVPADAFNGRSKFNCEVKIRVSAEQKHLEETIG
ncbi:hypothetical protein, partial [uncultured Treponema sp.]|uniref:hypothetical protein n=1 Tax=uncultured Treponema sp. TaxID=162155 RepID=UPI0026197A2C